MKANEAPEKIYIHEASAPELTEKLPYHIEYIRVDAFIKKACEWLRKGGNGWYLTSEFGEDTIDFIKLAENFKKYMEGE